MAMVSPSFTFAPSAISHFLIKNFPSMPGLHPGIGIFIFSTYILASCIPTAEKGSQNKTLAMASTIGVKVPLNRSEIFCIGTLYILVTVFPIESVITTL